MNLRVSLVVAVASVSTVVAFHGGCPDSNPCNKFTDGFCVGNKCFCPDGWTGMYCEQRILPAVCSGDSCLNGGTCFASVGCMCLDGFTGDYCDMNICQNGGTYGNDGCSCVAGFTGMMCEVQVGVTCLNGGTPTFPNSRDEPRTDNQGYSVQVTVQGDMVCNCPSGTTGDFCQGQCLNGGTYVPITAEKCSTASGCNYCICPAGVTGEHCEGRAVQCAKDKAFEPVALNQCNCKSQRWTGQTCSTDLCQNKVKDDGEDGVDCGGFCSEKSCAVRGEPQEPLPPAAYSGGGTGNLVGGDFGGFTTQVVENADGSQTFVVTGTTPGGQALELSFTVQGGAQVLANEVVALPPGSEGRGAPWMQVLSISCDGSCDITVTYSQPADGQKYGSLSARGRGGLQVINVGVTASDSSISGNIGLKARGSGSSKARITGTGTVEIRPTFGSSSGDDHSDVIVVTVLVVVVFLAIAGGLCIVYGCYRKNSQAPPGTIKGNDPYVEQYAASPYAGGEMYADSAQPQIEA